MRLIECYIESFGKLSRINLKFREGMNSYVHENGYGKTTITAFISAMLFGLSDTKKQDLLENERKHYFPWGGGAFGGWLSFSANGGEYRIERSFSQRASEDTFKLYDLKTGRESKAYSENVGKELFGIDQDGFERTVFLSERNLSGKNDNKSVSEKLSDNSGAIYDLGAMDDAIKLLEQRRRFYYKRGGEGEIADVEKELTKAKSELEKLQLMREEYTALNLDVQELENELERLNKERLSLEESLVDFGKKQEELLRIERLAKDREESLARLKELDEFFASGIPEKEEIESAHRNFLFSQSFVKDAGKSQELIDLEEKLKPVTRAEIESVLLELEGGNRPKSSLGYISAAILFILSIPFFFFNQVIAFILLGIGGLSLILTTTIYTNANTTYKNAEEILSRLSITDRQNRRETLKKLRADYMRLELLYEFEKSRVSELEESRKERKAAYDKALEFLVRFPTESAFPFDEIRKLIAEREAITLKLASTPKLESAPPDTTVAECPTALLADTNARIFALTLELRKREERISFIESELENEEALHSTIQELNDKLDLYRKNLFYLQKARSFLETARDNMNSRYLGATKEAFEKYVKLIDGENADYTMNASFEVSKNELGITRPSNAFSLGTRNLQYLATRLALTDTLFENEVPFMIFDDPFISFDDAHISAARDILLKLSASRQIIYFTCSESRRI